MMLGSLPSTSLRQMRFERRQVGAAHIGTADSHDDIGGALDFQAGHVAHP